MGSWVWVGRGIIDEQGCLYPIKDCVEANLQGFHMGSYVFEVPKPY